MVGKLPTGQVVPGMREAVQSIPRRPSAKRDQSKEHGFATCGERWSPPFRTQSSSILAHTMQKRELHGWSKVNDPRAIVDACEAVALLMRGEPASLARRGPSREGMGTRPGQPFQGVRLGDPQAPAWRVLSARACSPLRAPVDSIRNVVKAEIRECACSTGGTLPTHATARARAKPEGVAGVGVGPECRRLPLPYCHPPRLRPLDTSARVKGREF